MRTGMDGRPRGRTMVSTLALLLSCASLSCMADESAPAWVAEAASSAQRLGQQLVGTLQQAIARGGPVEAVSFCHLEAPAIATRVSAEHDLAVARTALRVRNPDHAPDAWERRQLEWMQARLAEGVPPDQLEVFAVQREDGQRTGRWMKAIPTQPLCLVCHGESLAPDVAAAIDAAYPQDQARGFRPGELRGAFTVSVKLDP